MKTGNEYTSCHVMGHKRAGLLFSVHESGTQIVIGEIEVEKEVEKDEKRKKPLLFRQHIYLNPAKMMREYLEAGFEMMATLCVRQTEYLLAVEAYRLSRIRDARELKAVLQHPGAGFILECLLNMEGHDHESKAMQMIAEEVYEMAECKRKNQRSVNMMNMLIEFPQAQPAGANTACRREDNNPITPHNIEELTKALKCMTHHTTMQYQDWTIQKGGYCGIRRGDSVEMLTSKIWISNTNGRVEKVCGLDEQSAMEVAAIIGMKCKTATE